MEAAEQRDVWIARGMLVLVFLGIMTAAILQRIQLGESRKVEKGIFNVFFLIITPLYAIYVGMAWRALAKLRVQNPDLKTRRFLIQGAFVPVCTAIGISFAQLTSNYPEWDWIVGGWLASLIVIIPMVYVSFCRLALK